LYVIVQVAHLIGLGLALLALVLVSVVGGSLVKREGMSVWRRLQEQLGRGELPGREVLDGMLVLTAGALLLAPGFVTDALGLLLLLPPVRAMVRTVISRRYSHSPRVIVATYGERIVDTSADEHRTERWQPRGQLEP
jgi:UPF0716 protein FxsA